MTVGKNTTHEVSSWLIYRKFKRRKDLGERVENQQFSSSDCKDQISYQIFFRGLKKYQFCCWKCFFQHQDTHYAEVYLELMRYEFYLHFKCKKNVAKKWKILGEINNSGEVNQISFINSLNTKIAIIYKPANGFAL